MDRSFVKGTERVDVGSFVYPPDLGRNTQTGYEERHLALKDAVEARLGLSLSTQISEAFERNPREFFVDRFRLLDSSRWFDRESLSISELQKLIYRDEVLVVTEDESGAPQSSLSRPSINAQILEALKLREGARVFEIGSGSGWLTAIMSHLVGAKGQVFGCEFDAKLAAASSDRLSSLGRKNVTILSGDGFRALADISSLDAVVVTATPHSLPQALVTSLAEGGRVVLPLRDQAFGAFVVALTREGMALKGKPILDGGFVPIRGPHGAGRLTLPTADSIITKNEHSGPQSTERRARLPLPDLGLPFVGQATDLCFFLSCHLPGFRPALASDFKTIVFMYPNQDGAVIIEPSGIRGVGGADAFERVCALCSLWVELGRPRIPDASLEITHGAFENRSAKVGYQTIEQRGECPFTWGWGGWFI